jgi:DNA-binding GntR family transcriptional regulator
MRRDIRVAYGRRTRLADMLETPQLTPPVMPPAQHLGRSSIVTRIALIAWTIVTANGIELAKLALNDPQAPVLRMTRKRCDALDRPLAYEEIVLPLSQFPRLACDVDLTSDILQLARRHGLSLGQATESVCIVRATTDIALHLGIAEGMDVLKLDRVTKTADGAPIEWRVTFAPERALRSALH